MGSSWRVEREGDGGAKKAAVVYLKIVFGGVTRDI